MSEVDGLSAQFTALKGAARALGFTNVDSWIVMHGTHPYGAESFRLFAKDPEGRRRYVFGMPSLLGLSKLEASEKLTTMAEVFVALEHARQQDEAEYRAHGIRFYGDGTGSVTLNCSAHPEWFATLDPGVPLTTMVATARGHHADTHGVTTVT